MLAHEYGFRTWTALLDFNPRMGHFDDIATFRIAREFDVPRERLWKATSEPDEIGTWLLPVSFELAVGARYAFRSQPSGSKPDQRAACAAKAALWGPPSTMP